MGEECGVANVGLQIYIHGRVNLVDCQTAVNLLHGGRGVLHCVEGFLVDVRRFYAAYLPLHGHHLCRCLL